MSSHEENPREWVRGIWEVWFDEVIPQLDEFDNSLTNVTGTANSTNKRPPADTSAALAESLAALLNVENKVAEVKEDVKEKLVTLPIYDLNDPIVDDEIEREQIEILKEEVLKLSTVLKRDVRSPLKAISLCRRGAILRKLGKLVSAMGDLNKAIDLVPNFVDALWHRHFIYLVEKDTDSAMTDLNLIVRIYRYHAGAYMSRAALYSERGDVIEAIDDYTMAIRSKPNNAEAYFLRAKLYEIVSLVFFCLF